MERIGSDSWDAANGRKLWIGIGISLLLHALLRIDNEQRRISICCTGDHILEKFLMTWGIDDAIFPLVGRELDLRRVNRNALLLFFLKSIQQIRILERLSRLLGDAPDLVHCALRQ